MKLLNIINIVIISEGLLNLWTNGFSSCDLSEMLLFYYY